jgi:hypothetical protein
MSDFDKKTAFFLNRKLYLDFFSRCSFYKIQPTKFLTFIMQEFVSLSPVTEELLEQHMKKEGLKYSSDLRDLYLKLHSVYVMKQEESFKSDLQENVKK